MLNEFIVVTASIVYGYNPYISLVCYYGVLTYILF